MTICSSIEPSIAPFFLSPESEKTAKINKALKKGQLSFILKIINRPECDTNTLKSILNGCIKYKCDSIVAIEILAKNIFENYKEKKTAIFAAAKKGAAPIVEELVKIDVDAFELLQKDQEKAIKIVIKQYKKKLASGDTPPSSLTGFLNIIITLLKKGPVSDEIRSSIIALAISSNYLHLLEQLLHMPSQEDTRAKAVIEAMNMGCKDLAKILFKNGSILKKDRGQILIEAIKSSDFDFVQEILESGSISKEARGEAVVTAVSRAPLSIIEKLLETGATISKKARGRAVVKAALNSLSSVIQFLLKDAAPVPEEAIREALGIGFLYSDVSIVNALGVTEYPPEFMAPSVLYTIDTSPVIDTSPALESLAVLRLSRDQLKHNPASYLLKASNGFLKVIFLNEDGTEQPGVDVAGLTKQFIHELLEQICLNNIIQLDDKRFPVCEIEANASSYTDLGKLLSVIDEKNDIQLALNEEDLPFDPIYIGSLFDPKVFDYFKDFLDPSLTDHQRIKKLANHLKTEFTEDLVNFLNLDEPTQEQINTFRADMEKFYLLDEGAYKDKTKKELQDMCKLPFKGHFKALSLIVSGFSEPLKAKILDSGEAYGLYLQGTKIFDKDELLSKIIIQEAPSLSEEKQLEVLKKQNWLFEKIAAELTNPESNWVKKFLFCVTGQPVLPAGKITIQGIAGAYCQAHTCANILDVPFDNLAPDLADKSPEELEELAKQIFFENLNLLILTSDYYFS